MALTSLQEALMLATLSPKSARRYLSLPLFGPVIDDLIIGYRNRATPPARVTINL